jgi:hypothetical protein
MSPTNILDTYARTIIVNPNLNYKPSMTFRTTVDYEKGEYSGPVSVGPNLTGYGIALSSEIMKRLRLRDGELVYFRLEE